MFAQIVFILFIVLGGLSYFYERIYKPGQKRKAIQKHQDSVKEQKKGVVQPSLLSIRSCMTRCLNNIDEGEMDRHKADIIARKQEEHERDARIQQRIRLDKQREIDEQVSIPPWSTN